LSNGDIIGFDRDQPGIQELPKKIAGVSKIKFLAAGAQHVLAIMKRSRPGGKDKIVGWGSNEFGQLRRPNHDRGLRGRANQLVLPYSWDMPTWARPRQQRHVYQVRAGAYHSFCINHTGQVYAWGLNKYGQLGVDAQNDDDYPDYIHEPQRVVGLQHEVVVDIWGGEHHSVACTQEGRLYAWGRLTHHAVGIDPENPGYPIPTEIDEDGELLLRVPIQMPPSKFLLCPPNDEQG
jgi:regulator of chromosome condensation